MKEKFRIRGICHYVNTFTRVTNSEYFDNNRIKKMFWLNINYESYIHKFFMCKSVHCQESFYFLVANATIENAGLGQHQVTN